MGEQLEVVDEVGSGFGSAFDAKDDDAAAFAFEVFLVFLEFGIVGESGETDPFDIGMSLKVFGDGEGVFTMAIHANMEGFDSSQDQKAIHGTTYRPAGILNIIKFIWY